MTIVFLTIDFSELIYDSFSLKKLPTHKKITSYDLAPSKSAGPPEYQDEDLSTGPRHILADLLKFMFSKKATKN